MIYLFFTDMLNKMEDNSLILPENDKNITKEPKNNLLI
jgi:hypothetical protein